MVPVLGIVEDHRPPQKDVLAVEAAALGYATRLLPRQQSVDMTHLLLDIGLRACIVSCLDSLGMAHVLARVESWRLFKTS